MSLCIELNLGRYVADDCAALALAGDDDLFPVLLLNFVRCGFLNRLTLAGEGRRLLRAKRSGANEKSGGEGLVEAHG
jgi:hypothetical protein